MPVICQLLRFRKIRNLVSIFSYIGLFNLHKDKNPNMDRVKTYLKICLSLIKCSKSIFRWEPRFLHHKIWKYNIIELFFLHQWKKLRLHLENWQILNCNLQVAELICLINLINPYQAPTLCLNCACLRQWNYLLSPPSLDTDTRVCCVKTMGVVYKLLYIILSFIFLIYLH